MAEAVYEAVPEVQPAAAPSSTGTLVMKFGGTSVADSEKIRRVAERLVAAKKAGTRVVGVVSAM
jgi:aspartate kinase